MVIAQAEFDDGGEGEEVTFARNSEVLQNDLSENYEPIGPWMLASGGGSCSGGELLLSGGSRECGCMVEGELLTLSTVAWGLKVAG